MRKFLLLAAILFIRYDKLSLLGDQNIASNAPYSWIQETWTAGMRTDNKTINLEISGGPATVWMNWRDHYFNPSTAVFYNQSGTWYGGQSYVDRKQLMPGYHVGTEVSWRFD